MEDIENATKDSLIRQIAEVKKQISKTIIKSNKKDLETRRIHDQLKSNIILKYLITKKNLKELQSFIEDQKKQWNLEYWQQEHVLIHSSSQIIKWQYSRIFMYEEIQDILKSVIPNNIQLLEGWNNEEEEETTARILLDPRCENLEQNNTLQVLTKLESIRREVFYHSMQINDPQSSLKASKSSSFLNSSYKNTSKTLSSEENFIRSKEDSNYKSVTSSSDNLFSLNSVECEKSEILPEKIENKGKKSGCCQRFLACLKRNV